MPHATTIVILLGNPGQKYALTRHNLGWWVSDILAADARISFRPGWGRFHLSQMLVKETTVTLVKPTTFMNLSGQIIPELAERLEVDVNRLLVVTDDIDLPLGKIRIRAHGSSGGHNGLASLIEVLGDDQFARVRCGVGPVPADLDPAEFVLAPFADNELPLARDMAARAAAAVSTILTDGVVVAANTYNRQPPAPDAPSGDQSGADRPREGT